MVFNVLVDECDDHVKNFAFRLREGGRWELAPANHMKGDRIKRVGMRSAAASERSR